MNDHSQRKEQRPDPVHDTKATGRAELPLDDPNYHYRIVSKEHETRERVSYHKDKGYGVAKETNRHVVMACKKDEHDARQRESVERSGRSRRAQTEPSGELVKDETTVEVSRGLHSPEEDE